MSANLKGGFVTEGSAPVSTGCRVCLSTVFALLATTVFVPSFHGFERPVSLFVLKWFRSDGGVAGASRFALVIPMATAAIAELALWVPGWWQYTDQTERRLPFFTMVLCLVLAVVGGVWNGIWLDAIGTSAEGWHGIAAPLVCLASACAIVLVCGPALRIPLVLTIVLAYQFAVALPVGVTAVPNLLSVVVWGGHGVIALLGLLMCVRCFRIRDAIG